ncbi:hypothetical protein ACF0H5_010054 [Mactra antiquata]
MDISLLYRVLRPDENLIVGILAQAPSSQRTLEEHISNGSRYSSKFISTSKSLEAAISFASMSRNRPVRIVRIDVTELIRSGQCIQIIDLTNPFVVNQHISINNDIARDWVERFQEVVIVGSIPPQCLKLETVVQ